MDAFDVFGHENPVGWERTTRQVLEVIRKHWDTLDFGDLSDHLEPEMHAKALASLEELRSVCAPDSVRDEISVCVACLFKQCCDRESEEADEWWIGNLEQVINFALEV